MSQALADKARDISNLWLHRNSRAEAEESLHKVLEAWGWDLK